MNYLEDALTIIRAQPTEVMAVLDDGRIIIVDDDVDRAWEEEEITIKLIHLPRTTQHASRYIRPSDPCPYPASPCTCQNGIGCVNVPFSQW